MEENFLYIKGYKKVRPKMERFSIRISNKKNYLLIYPSLRSEAT